MYNVKHNAFLIKESEVIEMIFNACRGNEARKGVTFGDYRVTFDNRYTKQGEHLATVQNLMSRVCGSAIVDQFDC